ncbi:unnamed protein product [Didymodactylos carnosus]|uniref:ABC transporter domain-containing protein n=1 Tax=Didymodactylos carnosus TaxID=1234261 RepID=A0A8S2CRY4_9BILA|nr:unnamed protein product [Didymodactylos carnosus]CAF3568632.1 unnamed protein product [Didymodactylos carnosus]
MEWVSSFTPNVDVMVIASESIENRRVIAQLTKEDLFINKYSNLIHQTYRISAVVLFVAQTFQTILTLTEELAKSLVAAKDFFDLFERQPVIDNCSTKGKIIFCYPTRPERLVLDNFQLNINNGQRIAIVGASGCGKSTIVQLIERFYDVKRGCLSIDGQNIKDLNLQWLRSKISLVSQEPVLFDMSIKANIAYGDNNRQQKDITMHEIIEAAKKANIHDFIQSLPEGYDTNVGLRGLQMSGGEKQRIAIGRALLRQPKILILDEATSALDTLNEKIVQEAISSTLENNKQLTCIIIAHNLSTVEHCDCLFVMNEHGQIVEYGKHHELLKKRGHYYNLTLNKFWDSFRKAHVATRLRMLDCIELFGLS